MAKNAVAKKDAAGLPADIMADLEADATTYEETMGRDDMSIPFLQILQSLSPQCIDGDPLFIEEARPGMFYNTVTKKLYDGKVGVLLVAINYTNSVIEWVTRQNGGGFVDEYTVAEGSTIRTVRNEVGQDIIQEDSPLGTPGNQSNPTHTHVLFIVNEDGTFEAAVATMASTQIKPSKNWNALINGLCLHGTTKRAARFYGLWRAKTTMRKNDQGSWYVWDVENEGGSKGVFSLENGGEIYAAAKDFRSQLESGEREVDHSKAGEEVSSEENPNAPKDGDAEGEIPF
jgi:hypothetical protein